MKFTSKRTKSTTTDKTTDINFLKGDVVVKVHETTIRRMKKYQAEQAIADLEKRGYELVFPLTEMKREGKTYSSDEYKRINFVENIGSSVWICKLRRVVE